MLEMASTAHSPQFEAEALKIISLRDSMFKQAQDAGYDKLQLSQIDDLHVDLARRYKRLLIENKLSKQRELHKHHSSYRLEGKLHLLPPEEVVTPETIQESKRIRIALAEVEAEIGKDSKQQSIVQTVPTGTPNAPRALRTHAVHMSSAPGPYHSTGQATQRPHLGKHLHHFAGGRPRPPPSATMGLPYDDEPVSEEKNVMEHTEQIAKENEKKAEEQRAKDKEIEREENGKLEQEQLDQARKEQSKLEKNSSHIKPVPQQLSERLQELQQKLNKSQPVSHISNDISSPETQDSSYSPTPSLSQPQPSHNSIPGLFLSSQPSNTNIVEAESNAQFIELDSGSEYSPELPTAQLAAAQPVPRVQDTVKVSLPAPPTFTPYQTAQPLFNTAGAQKSPRIHQRTSSAQALPQKPKTLVAPTTVNPPQLPIISPAPHNPLSQPSIYNYPQNSPPQNLPQSYERFPPDNAFASRYNVPPPAVNLDYSEEYSPQQPHLYQRSYGSYRPYDEQQPFTYPPPPPPNLSYDQNALPYDTSAPPYGRPTYPEYQAPIPTSLYQQYERNLRQEPPRGPPTGYPYPQSRHLQKTRQFRRFGTDGPNSSANSSYGPPQYGDDAYEWSGY